jgi:hypothetical protein
MGKYTEKGRYAEGQGCITGRRVVPDTAYKKVKMRIRYNIRGRRGNVGGGIK